MKKKNWHLSGREVARASNGGIFDEILKDIISKIKYTAVLQDFTKLGRNILWPFVMMKKYNNWTILARLGGRKQTKR